ncbi:MAG: NAD(P)H-dependent glycerol-3-phosphate dehydrogenase [Raoultibacter sp.]
MRVSVIGAGSWGTALSQILAASGHDVVLWARKPEVVASINEQHRNPRYLSDITLSENLSATASIEEALTDTNAVVVVTPSNLMRDIAQALSSLVADDTPIIVCSKGVEEGSGLLPVEVFEAELGGKDRLAVLSGPNHAEEVIKQVFSATVIASSSQETAEFFQHLFATETFRTYVSDDACGVELCAAFKNVIAIAVGLSYGLGYGDNTAALLMTRGLAEMSRLVAACGGNPLTCMGLAGTGDLIATCTSEHSRNRRFGAMIAQGKTLADFEADTHMVAEGAFACKTLQTLARMYDVELPITNVVRGVVWEGADMKEATLELAGRPLTTEFYGI